MDSPPSLYCSDLVIVNLMWHAVIAWAMYAWIVLKVRDHVPSTTHAGAHR
jgi:hypothetical protein